MVPSIGGHLGWRDPLLSESHTSPGVGPPWCRGWGLTQTSPNGWRAGPTQALPPLTNRKGGFYFEPRAVAQNQDFYLSLLRPALVSQGTPHHQGHRAFNEAGS